VYRREGSRRWQCAVFIGGVNHRQSTRQTNLAAAFDFAKDWYLDRVADERLKQRGIELPGVSEPKPKSLAPAKPKSKASKAKAADKTPTFREAAKAFVAEYQVITHGERNACYVANKSSHLDNHLLPFLGDRPVTEVTAGVIQDYRVHRLTPPKEEEVTKPIRLRRGERRKPRRKWKRPARATLHSEMVTLRQVLKTANRKGWIAGLPDMSAPYKSSVRSGIGPGSRPTNTSASMRRPGSGRAIH
jgi:hypothetical protein